MIGEDGGNLSQGQKQLLCIAWVMLCLPPMLILDEATSSIDTRTEIRIQKAFSRMMEGRTSFIVAHRLSTIREADRILVMKAGRIVEQGTHGDLLEKNGFTRRFTTASLRGSRAQMALNRGFWCLGSRIWDLEIDGFSVCKKEIVSLIMVTAGPAFPGPFFWNQTEWGGGSAARRGTLRMPPSGREMEGTCRNWTEPFCWLRWTG